MTKIPFNSVLCKEKNPALNHHTDSFLLAGAGNMNSFNTILKAPLVRPDRSSPRLAHDAYGTPFRVELIYADFDTTNKEGAFS